MREWRQFQLLARDSLRRLLNAAVLARDGDPWQFAIWATVLVQTPPTMYAMSVAAKYATLRHAPAAAAERVLLGDRMFFVFYAMVAAALLAAATWDALFPDRVDQEIVGVLPVRPRTLAASRLAAAMAMALAFAAAVCLPSAIVFSVFSLTHQPFLHVGVMIAGHLAGAIGGAMAVFAVLVALRGIAAVVLPSSASSVVAALLQLAAISGLIETFLYVPSILPRLVDAMRSGGPGAMRLPPVWFAALYDIIAGDGFPVLWTEAARGMLVFGVAIVSVVVLYLVPAAWLARRALESSSTRNVRTVSALTRLSAQLSARAPRVRALTMFGVASFTRSRRHVLVLVTQLGIGISIASLSLVAATMHRTLDLHAPSQSLLAVPLVLMFFCALGLRAAFTMPTDFDANWPFRIAERQTAHAAAASRRAMVLLVVAPIAILIFAATLAIGWPSGVATSAALFDLLAGALLVECVMYGWHAVPFARERALSNQSLKWRGLVMVVPLAVFAFGGAAAQMAALSSPRAAAWYAFVIASLALAVHHVSLRETARHTMAFDDEGADSLAMLNLSNAN
jgi:hypothetical protein